MWVIFRKELLSFFYSLMALSITSFFVIVIGIFTWIYPGYNILDSGYANMSLFFNVSPYIFCFLISALTMVTFSEEYKSGNMDILLTSPLSVFKIVFGKYLAVLLIVALILFLSLTYVLTIYFIALPEGNIDIAAIFSSYLGLFSLSSLFCAIGIYCSICNSTQIVAFIFSTGTCLFLYSAFDLFTILFPFNKTAYFLQQLGIKYHYDEISKGVISFKDLFYMLTFTYGFLLLSEKKINLKKH